MAREGTAWNGGARAGAFVAATKVALLDAEVLLIIANIGIAGVDRRWADDVGVDAGCARRVAAACLAGRRARRAVAVNGRASARIDVDR